MTGRPRAFDWDHARVLYEEHRSYAAVARLIGVSSTAVRRALNPSEQLRMSRLQKKKKRWRAPCVAGCGRMATVRGGRSGLCMRCSALTRAPSVREGELCCGECRQWKPDGQFPKGKGNISRRGRHAICRLCQPIVRKRHRDAHPELKLAANKRRVERRRRQRERERAVV